MRSALLLVLALLAAAPAAAHRLAPSYLELVELADRGEPGGRRVALLWKTPRVVARDAVPRPLLPARCHETAPPTAGVEGSAWLERRMLACDGGLVGSEVGVEALRTSGTNALVRVALADGREVRAVLRAEDPRLVVPARERAGAVLRGYLELGTHHLLAGLDHVLFLLGLVWLLRRPGPLLKAVTAFTAGHSLTLALAALGTVGLPPAAVEVAIAATLVVLGLETARPDPERSPLVRRPGLAPFGFGLVHGLGFAGALAEAGLPGHAVPLALFGFNLGIELAQVGLVLVAIAALRPLRSAGRRLPRILAELPATAIGSLGVCLGLERAVAWLGGSG